MKVQVQNDTFPSLCSKKKLLPSSKHTLYHTLLLKAATIVGESIFFLDWKHKNHVNLHGILSFFCFPEAKN